MTKNLTIAVLGVALLAVLVFLIPKGCVPIDTPPVPTPVPTQVPSEEPCEFRTIMYKLGKPSTGDEAVFAHPEELDWVKQCAQVIFVNQTPKNITIKFGSAENSPFSEIYEISLDSVGEGNQFSKGFLVNTAPVGDDGKWFPYKIEPDGSTEQTPRIRIGPGTPPEVLTPTPNPAP